MGRRGACGGEPRAGYSVRDSEAKLHHRGGYCHGNGFLPGIGKDAFLGGPGVLVRNWKEKFVVSFVMVSKWDILLVFSLLKFANELCKE